MSTAQQEALSEGAATGGRDRIWPLAAVLLSSVFAALPLLDRVSLPALAALAGVAAVGLASLWRSARGWRQAAVATSIAAPTGAQASSALSGLLAGVLPVWLQHVDTVSHQTDDAVGKLIGSFSTITDQFEAAGF